MVNNSIVTTSINYIESIIDIHQETHGIYFHSNHREYIIDKVNKGVYAFQVKYRYSMPGGSGTVTKGIKNLDYSLLRSKNIYGPGGEIFNKLWSYDGGQRYQWTEIETLFFDPSVIRNIKLEEIIQ
jgi:hypothetical protein